MAALLLTGEHEYSIDAMGRIPIPSDVRVRMNPEKDGIAFYLTMGPNKTLCLYPEKTFERLADQVEDGLVTDEVVQDFVQLMFPLSSRLDFDSVGRLRLPKKMIERAGLEKKIILIGTRDHFEIRDRIQWEEEIKKLLDNQTETYNRFAQRRRERDSELQDSSTSSK